jgi:DNA-binding CsgD family transcriptional regulator
MFKPEEWNLTPQQTDVMDTLLECGTLVKAAKKLGIKARSVHMHLWRIKQKAGIDETLLLAVAWDRYSRKPVSTAVVPAPAET